MSEEAPRSPVDEIFALYRLVYDKEPPKDYAEQIRRRFEPLIIQRDERPRLLAVAH